MTNVASERCAACDRVNCSIDNPDCPYYHRCREPHADAQLGDNVGHMRQMAIAFEARTVIINGKRFLPGGASSESCNCLIDTLRQVLHLQCDLAGVRRHLMTLFPDGPKHLPNDLAEVEAFLCDNCRFITCTAKDSRGNICGKMMPKKQQAKLTASTRNSYICGECLTCQLSNETLATLQLKSA